MPCFGRLQLVALSASKPFNVGCMGHDLPCTEGAGVAIHIPPGAHHCDTDCNIAASVEGVRKKRNDRGDHCP